MVYMGSKAKYAGHIVPILQNEIDKTGATLYIEPFVGGANVIDKIRCEQRIGYDRSETLIALLNQARDNFDALPEDGNREMWDEGKAYVKDGVPPTTMSLADIGAIEFFASFSNGGFPRGYAKNTSTRNYYKEAYRNMKAQAPNLKDIEFYQQNYWELNPDISGAVIYCDPPYQGTKFYGYAKEPKMDYEQFWNWVREISVNNSVFISEQTAPDDFEVVWEQEVKRTAGKDNNFKAVEKLFKWKGKAREK